MWKYTKQTTLFIAFFLLITSSSQSQIFQGGIKGGLVASEVSGDHLSGANKTGFFVSSYTFIPLKQHSKLQLEVMYIQKGSKSVPKEENQFFDYKFSLQYVEVPILYYQELSRFTDTPYLKSLQLYGGLSASVLVNYEELENGASILSPEREDFKTIEANMLAGISYPINNALYFTFGFSNSLTPIRSHASGATTIVNKGQYHSLWTLGLSYIFW